MKNWTIAFLLLACLSCKKESETTPSPSFDELSLENYKPFSPGDKEFGCAEGNQNDAFWEASSEAVFHTNDKSKIGIYFSVLGQDRFIESLTLNDFPIDTGTFLMNNDYQNLQDGIIGNSYTMDEWDVELAGYKLDSNFKNEVVISKIDTIQRIVEGRFNALFLLDRNYLKIVPDSIKFENVSFFSTILDD